MKIYSHPDVLLIDHLEKVAIGSKKFISNSISEDFKLFSKSILMEIGYICGAFHDIGKATEYFDYYLQTKGKVKGPKNHALISALFVRQVVLKYLANADLISHQKELLATYAYIAVRRHHGGILDFKDEVFLFDKAKELNQIISAFYKEAVQNIINYFLYPLQIEYSFIEFENYIKGNYYENDLLEFYDEVFEFGDYFNQDISDKVQLFYVFQLLYSSLLLADKEDVIIKEDIPSGSELFLDCLEKYRAFKNFNKSCGKDNIGDFKNKAYFATLQNLNHVYKPNKHIYSITLPTGFGKTLTSFGVALELIKLNPSINKIIISIPFTSIIDQNFEVYQEIVGSVNSSILLKHHHQAQPSYKLGEDCLTPDVSQFLIETWHSKIVVTTFVQLMDSIFSADKGLIMKIPNIANSVVILDEIQTINYKLWPLIKEVFFQLGQILNCYFIFMSATQPLIFIPEEEIAEMVPEYRFYFGLFNRTRIINKTAVPITIQDFIEEIVVYTLKHPKNNILVILNTKKTCRDVFRKLREVVNLDRFDLYFMSTLITPFERKQIIKKIKNEIGEEYKPKIVVTTQLIEAGVDISVDTVFRVLAPIDSIIQAAGRANRYNEKGQICDVILYELEESRIATARVYGSDLITKSKNVLKDISVIEEKHYLTLIESYFREVRMHSEHYQSEYLSNIENLEFASLGKFSLIEESNSESIFVQVSEEARTVWAQFLSIYNDERKTIFDKRLEFSKIKSEFYNYVINVPIPFGQKTISFDSEKINGFYLVEYGKPTPFYSYSPDSFLTNLGYIEVENIFS